MSGGIRDLAVRRPGWVLLATLVVSATLAGGLSRLRIDASIESMIVENDPDRVAFEARKQVFGSDEVVSIALSFDDALAPEALDVQRRIARRLETLPQIAEVDSLVTSDEIMGRDQLLDVRPLVPEDPSEWDAASLAHARERVATNALWIGFLISRDGRTAALQLRLDDPASTGTDRGALLSRVESIVDEERGETPYHIAGHPFMKTEIARTMQRDLRIFLPVTFAVMTLFLIVCVGSLRVAAVMLAAVTLSLVWMLGFMGWIDQPVTALSNTAPTILVALGTAYLMHLVASYQRAASAGGPRREVVLRALARVRKPIVVAGLTTAIGFSVLATSSVPLVRGFGIDLAAGILSVIVLACFSVPAALTFLQPRPSRGVLANERHLGTLLFYVARFASLHPRKILAGALVLLAAALVTSTRLTVDSSGPNAFADDSRFRRSSEFYRTHFSGDVIQNVYLRAGDDGFKDPERLRRMLAFQREAERLPQIDKTISIANYIKLMNRAVHGNDPAHERVPDTREAVAQYLLLYASAGDPDEFDDLVDPFYSEARIVLKATVLSSMESAELRRQLETLAAVYLREEAGPRAVLSTEILLSQAADTLAIEQVRGLAGALLMILLVVTVAFRSLRAGALLGLPNGLPIALNFGIMALIGITLREATSVIAVTALGIAVDSTVHLLQAIRVSEADHRSRRAAVLEAMLTTGRPVVVTSGIIIAGFALLLLSDFRVISDFGGLTALAIAFALLADLLVLPAQLLIARRQGAHATADPVLVTGASTGFPALLDERQRELLGVRPLGEVAGWEAWHATPVSLRALTPGGEIRGRLEGVADARGDRLEIRIGAPRSGVGALRQRFAELLAGPRTKEFRHGGYHFRVADSVEERQRAYALRYDVFASEGFIDPSDFRSTSFRDALDEVALQATVLDREGDLVGAARLVLPSPLGFQTEQLFEIDPAAVSRSRLGEIGRLALRSGFRGGDRLPLLGLIKLIYDAIKENELTHAYAFMPADLIQSLNALGAVSQPLEARTPGPETLRRRDLTRGYFERQEPAPVLFVIEEMDRELGID